MRGATPGSCGRQAALAVMVLTAWPAAAQILPPSIDPGRQEQRFTPPPEPRSPGPPLAVPPAEPAIAPPGSARLGFRLVSVDLEGVTAYPPQALAPLYADLIGRTITLEQVFQLAETLTRRYREDGYILSQVIVPAQEIREGRLRLVVVEGFIARYEIAGATQAAGPVARYAERLLAERPVTARTLERYLLLMNDLPGVKVQAVLAPSPEAQGGTDVTLKVEERRAEAGFAIDNRGTRYLGPTQPQGNVKLNGGLGWGEAIGLRGIVTLPPHELRLGELQGEVPLGGDGLKLGLRISRSDTHPGYTLSALDITGDNTAGLLELSYPIIRSRERNLSTALRLGARESQTRSFGAVLSDDRVRTVAVGTTFDTIDSWRGIDLAFGELAQGLDAFGASHAGAPLLSRANGRPDFTKFSGGVSRVQGLWPGVNLRFDLEGQYAFSQLLAAEQFGIGGPRFGRAYDPSEVIGDHGLAGRIELQWGPELPADILLQAVQLYGFYDLGRVWRIDGNPGGLPQSLASAGGGLRVSLLAGISGFAEVAQPLTFTPAAIGNRNPRIFLGITSQF